MKSTESVPSLLVVDDQADVLDALRLLFKSEGWQTETVTSPARALAAAQASDFDVIIIDLNYTRDTTSGQEGLDLLDKLLAMENPPPVVVMTAWATVEVAVEAMRRGARDFIQKPWENNRVVTITRTQIELGRALRQSQRLREENQLLRGDGVPVMIADSPAMRPVI